MDLFQRRLGYYLLVGSIAVPWVWWPVKNYLSNCYSLMQLCNTSSIGYRTRQLRGVLCVDCVLQLALAWQLTLEVGNAHRIHKGSGTVS